MYGIQKYEYIFKYMFQNMMFYNTKPCLYDFHYFLIGTKWRHLHDFLKLMV